MSSFSGWTEPQMHVIVNRTRDHPLRLASESGPRVFQKIMPPQSTTRVEQALIMINIVLLPAQDYEDYIPAPGGLSIIFIIFGLSLIYILLNRFNELSKIWFHPVFRAAYLFLCVAVLMESVHPLASYAEIIRIGQMFLGALIIATMCRDRHALRTSIYGYIVAGIWVSVFVFMTSYDVLQGATVTGFDEATLLRGAAFGDMSRGTNPNALAFYCAQGAVVALALALTARISRHRILFFGIALFCFISAFLPLSRGGVAVVILSCVAVMWRSGIKYGKVILVAAVLASTAVLWVPDAVWNRMTFSVGVAGEKQEGRARVYTAAIEHLPEYVMTGIGSGHFWKLWGREKAFRGSGAHNSVIQVMIYWGLPGLLALIGVVWQAYRFRPNCSGGDALTLCLLGLTVSLLLVAQLGHNLYSKEFSFGLGLLVGSRHWIWPTGTVLLAQKNSSVL